MITYPRVSHRQPDKDRTFAGAINHLLNKLNYLHVSIVGKPTAGEVILDTEFPVPLFISFENSLLVAETGATASAAWDISVGGSTAATITFGAGQSTGTSSVPSIGVPARTRFTLTAPGTQDATLSDITLSLAASR